MRDALFLELRAFAFELGVGLQLAPSVGRSAGPKVRKIQLQRRSKRRQKRASQKNIQTIGDAI